MTKYSGAPTMEALMGAIDVTSNHLVLPQQAALLGHDREYRCVSCSQPVMLKAGAIRRPHFAHFPTPEPCTYFEHPSESQIHKTAKLAIASALNNGANVVVSCKTICTHDSIVDISKPAGGQVRVEHAIGKGCTADVALLTPDGNLSALLEIRHTHATLAGTRPEPWYEFNARDVLLALHADPMSIQLSCKRTDRYCKDCAMPDSVRVAILGFPPLHSISRGDLVCTEFVYSYGWYLDWHPPRIAPSLHGYQVVNHCKIRHQEGCVIWRAQEPSTPAKLLKALREFLYLSKELYPRRSLNRIKVSRLDHEAQGMLLCLAMNTSDARDWEWRTHWDALNSSEKRRVSSGWIAPDYNDVFCNLGDIERVWLPGFILEDADAEISKHGHHVPLACDSIVMPWCDILDAQTLAYWERLTRPRIDIGRAADLQRWLDRKGETNPCNLCRAKK